ncbi:recombinase family protein [Frigoribacterium sp. SL97]|uniref:recombinase family protein n=1 Tax=Frigoribacterium sp. SL97 TaxID=2994664 RepID=UPI00227018EA|nr:recombinase family protein [Frigoribacterium sp. SL97]WAC53227.1 recombinase family protein [Frigoribacterium sp. SL97]
MDAGAGRRAAIYARISRDKKDEGRTIEGQLDLCRALARRHGLTVVAEYPEADGTGASEQSKAKERERYGAMLAAARDREFDTIIAYSDDRLTRRPLELEELIKLVDQTGLSIRTVRTENYDLSTTQGITLARILGAIAAGEARTISERQKVTFERNAYAGRPKRQRQRPFGWEDDAITIREEEAHHIRKAVEEIKGGASVASIAHGWNEAGIRTAVDPAQSKKEEKPAGQWEWSVVYRVLLGWRTAGVRTYRREPLYDAEGKLVMGAWAPIISLQDRDQALAMLSRLSRTKLRTGSWPLAGMLRCGECSKPLYGQLPSGSRGRALYGCKQGHVGISAGLLEQHLIRETVERAVRAHQAGASAEETQPKQPADWPDFVLLTAATEKIWELLEAYRASQLPASIVFPQVGELEKEQRELQKSLDAFLMEGAAPPSPLRRSTEALEWLLGVQGQFLRITPRQAKDGENQLWGAPAAAAAQGDDRTQELPYAASPEETEELNRLLRGELEMVVIKKGKAGRQSEAQFRSRIDPVWRK